MYKNILVAALAASLSLGAFAQEKMYLIKGNEVVAKYNVGDVDYVSFELPEGVEDNTGDEPSLIQRQYASAVGLYYGTTDNVADYVVQLSTRSLMDENTPVDFLYLQIMGPAADFHNLTLPEGTYTIQDGDTREAFKYYKGVRNVTLEGETIAGTLVVNRPNNNETSYVLVTGGSFTVAKAENGYSISGTLKLENDAVLDFSYEGACVIDNHSDEKDPADILPLPDSKLTEDVTFTVGEAYYGNYGEMFEDKPGFVYNYVYLYSGDYAYIVELGLLVDKSKANGSILPKGKYTVAKLGSADYNSDKNIAIAPFEVMGETSIGTYGSWITVGYVDKSPLVTGEIEILEDFDGTNDLKISVNLKDNSETPHTVTVSYSGKAEKL